MPRPGSIEFLLWGMITMAQRSPRMLGKDLPTVSPTRNETITLQDGSYS